MYRKTMTIVVAVIKNREGKILLAFRRDKRNKMAHNKWELTGGKISFSEQPNEAVIREVKEETGLTVRIKRLIPYIHVNYWRFGRKTTVKIIMLAYECTVVGGSVQLSDREVQHVRWFKKQEIQRLKNTLPGVREIVSCV